jgi:hypothetical protein
MARHVLAVRRRVLLGRTGGERTLMSSIEPDDTKPECRSVSGT